MKNFHVNGKIFACVVMLVCTTVSGYAQEIHFSQFFEAPMLRNPALAGIFNGDYRIQGVYRDQWNSFTNAYRTGSFNAEYKMPIGKGDDFITTAMQFLYDKSGTAGLSTTQAMPVLNYHKSLSADRPMYLSLGFMGGVIFKSIDISKITTNNQYNNGFDPSLPSGETFSAPNYTSWDASAGMSFNSAFGAENKHYLFLGAAYHHLNRPRNSFYRDPSVELNPKYVFSAGIRWWVDDYSYFTLQADHSMQGVFDETIGGGLYSYKIGDDPANPLYTLHAGAFLRWRDAFIPVLKIDFGSLSAAISYDVNVSTLKTASQGRGGFELSISYIGFVEHDNSSKYKMLCPRF